MARYAAFISYSYCAAEVENLIPGSVPSPSVPVDARGGLRDSPNTLASAGCKPVIGDPLTVPVLPIVPPTNSAIMQVIEMRRFMGQYLNMAAVDVVGAALVWPRLHASRP
jgi:hypothetical protein